MDARKAFNTVWHEGLLVQLFQKGIKGTSSTTGMLPPVGVYSGTARGLNHLLQGVRQGSVLSPFSIAYMWTSSWINSPSPRSGPQSQISTAGPPCTRMILP